MTTRADRPEKRPLVVFGEDWGRHPSSTQHLVRRLAARRPVVWMNSIGLRRPRMNAGDLQRLAAKAAAIAGNGPRTQNAAPDDPPPPGVTVVAPWALPFPGSAAASAANARLFRARLKPYTERMATAPILWCSLPTAVSAVGQLGEAAVVYYAGDDFSALEGVDHDAVARLERRLCAKADLTISASRTIDARLRPFTRNLRIVVEHGCDVALFGAPSKPAPELAGRNPVAGYYGAIAGWLDLELLVEVATRAPHWTFVLIGPVKTNTDRLRAAPNIRLLPPAPHQGLPAFSQHWAASLLPFRDTPQIRASNSLKLREYLAAGSPVVASAAAPLHGFERHVRRASTAADVIDALEAARCEPAAAWAARRAAVANETWEARADLIDAALDRLVGDDRARAA